MSMLGLMVGVTPVISMDPVSKNRVRMSLALDPMMNCEIGSPIFMAT
jgi:hypothetical protein